MYPFLFAAAAASLYYLISAVQRPRLAGTMAAILWVAYAVYEYYVANGTLCDANCNIRVDLLLLLPILAIASVLAAQAAPRPAVVAIFYTICLGLVGLLAAAFGNLVVATIAWAGALAVTVYGIGAVSKSRRLADSQSGKPQR